MIEAANQHTEQKTDASLYNAEFYAHRHQSTTYAAEQVFKTLLPVIPEPHSAIDFGCGVGTWLNTLQNMSKVETVTGVDGPWVQTDMLEIPKQSFHSADLNPAFPLQQRYDLAMSLEAAEHLYPESAPTFVKTLCDASDFILFSAAVPGQEGKNHFNEQWPEYWQALFDKQSYEVVDCLRGPIWHDDKIPFWYRQNVLLYVKSSRLNELTLDATHRRPPLSIVHPLIFEERYKKTLSIKETFKWYRRAIKRAINIKRGKDVQPPAGYR